MTMLGHTMLMPRAIPPARFAAVFVAVILVTAAALLSVGTASADAASSSKPCWKRALDDWSDNGRMDGVYSASCLQQAINRLPEDIRIYSTAEETIRHALQPTGRTLQGGGVKNTARKTQSDTSNAPVSEVEPKVAVRGPGPISSVLTKDTTSADSIPVPLMILAGLALILMTAGGAGLVSRKLQARRLRSS